MEISEEDLIRIEDKIEKLKASKFKQQMLPAWRPVPSFGSTMIIFGVFGMLFLFLGITLYVMSEKVQGVVLRYDEECLQKQGGVINYLDDTITNPRETEINPLCELSFTVESEIEAPVYVYY